MRKPPLSAWALALSVLTLQCAAPRSPAPQPAPPAPQVKAPRGLGEAEAAPPAATAEEILGTLVFSSTDKVLSQALAYVQPYVAPPFRALLQPAPLQAQLAKTLGFPGLEQAIDSTRPLAIAFADPERHPSRRKLGPLVLVLPVRNEQALLEGLRKEASSYRRGSWNSHVLVFGQAEVWLRFAESYAVLASDRPLVDGAPAVLLPLVRVPAPEAVRLHIDVAGIHRRYGAQIAQALAKARQGQTAGAQGAQAGQLLQRGEQWLGYLSSMAAIDAKLDLQPNVIKFDGRATAQPSGAFPTYLTQLRPGPAWGAKFLPAQSAVAVLSHSTPQIAQAELEGQLSTLQTLLQNKVPASSWQKLREAISQNANFLGGASAVALWANPDGTAGWSGAVQLAGDPAAGHATLLKTVQLVAQQLDQLMQGLPPALAEPLKGLRPTLKVRPGAVRVGGARADLLELDLRTAAKSEPGAQELKRKLTAVLGGSRLTTAMLVLGDTLLMSGGKDYRRQLAQMIASAKATAGGGLESIVQSTLGGRQLVSYVYLPLATFAEQALRIAERVTTLPPTVKDVLHKVLPGSTNGIPLVAVVNVDGPQLVLEATVSSGLVGVITQVVMEIISRFGMGAGAAPSPP